MNELDHRWLFRIVGAAYDFQRKESVEFSVVRSHDHSVPVRKRAVFLIFEAVGNGAIALALLRSFELLNQTEAAHTIIVGFVHFLLIIKSVRRGSV